MGVRYTLETQGNAVIVKFLKKPSERVRDMLKEYGYRYHHSSRSWVGRRHKEEVKILLANWSRRCQSIEDSSYHRATLCWSCKNACGKCAWSRNLEPVEGWTALRHDVKTQTGRAGFLIPKLEESYIVIRCPEYERG